MDEPALRRPEDGTCGERAAAPAGRRVPSGELLGERGELIIVHAGREYRLRLTQSGKLILTA
jgi:hemin uptake protein HemP